MTKRKILATSGFSIIFLFAVSYFSVKFGSILVPEAYNFAIYLLAGFSVALIALFFAMDSGHIEKISDYKTKSFYVTILSAIAVVFIWKMLESFTGQVSSELLFGLIGGFMAYFYFTKTNKSKPVVHYHDFYFPKTVKQ